MVALEGQVEAEETWVVEEATWLVVA